MTRKTITNQFYIKIIKGLMDTSKNIKGVVLQKNIFQRLKQTKKHSPNLSSSNSFPSENTKFEPHQILLGKVRKINMVTVYFNYFQILQNYCQNYSEILSRTSDVLHVSNGSSIVMRCAIWYCLYNLKNVKNTNKGVLLLVKLQTFSLQLYEK